MDIDEAFVAEIRRDPHADVPRLVLADYLEDVGDPLGEFIRVQVELAGDSVSDRIALQQREEELINRYAEQWLNPLSELGAEGLHSRCFHRGLVERIRIPAPTFVENVEALCRRAPALHIVALREPLAASGAFRTLAMPAQIRGLDLSANRLGPGNYPLFQSLAESPWVRQIEMFDLQFNQIANDDVMPFISERSHAWERLQTVELAGNNLRQWGPLVFGHPDKFPFVRRLNLAMNAIDDDECQAFVSTREARWESLQDLDLSSNPLGQPGMQELTRCSFPQLRRLVLRATQLRQEGAAQIESASWSALQHLDLRNSSSPPEICQRLATRFDAEVLH